MAVTGGVVERYGPARKVTMTVGATPTVEGRLVEYSGDQTVIPAAANSLKVAGVSMQSGGATGDKVAVAHEGILELTASGAIAAGDYVKAGAAGVVVAVAADGDPRLIVGKALAAIVDTAKGPIKLLC